MAHEIDRSSQSVEFRRALVRGSATERGARIAAGVGLALIIFAVWAAYQASSPQAVTALRTPAPKDPASSLAATLLILTVACSAAYKLLIIGGRHLPLLGLTACALMMGCWTVSLFIAHPKVPLADTPALTLVAIAALWSGTVYWDLLTLAGYIVSWVAINGDEEDAPATAD